MENEDDSPELFLPHTYMSLLSFFQYNYMLVFNLVIYSPLLHTAR